MECGDLQSASVNGRPISDDMKVYFLILIFHAFTNLWQRHASEVDHYNTQGI